MTTNPKTHIDVYQIVTDRIITQLEKGVVPWRQMWADAGIPRNLISGKAYKGINVWLLTPLNYTQNYFLTYNQVRELGGSIKKGEKSREVIFWKQLEKENLETKKKETIPILRYYNVFNITQCTGIPIEKLPPSIERNNDPIKSCEEIISKMPNKPEIRHIAQEAYFDRENDFINLPKMETFKDSESYYSTLFHELVHSTGHTSRLNRNELMNSKGMKTNDYAVEELTAELGSCYLKSLANIAIEQLDNSASYINTWLNRLKQDKKFIVHASAQAQKATDYILNMPCIEREGELRGIRENQPQLNPNVKVHCI